LSTPNDPEEKTLFRLATFRGCGRCPHYIPPQPPSAAYCHKLLDYFDQNHRADQVCPDCPLPGPGDPHQRHHHIRGCWDCPHWEYLPPRIKRDSRCRLTGLTFNYAWVPHPCDKMYLPEPDDGWAHRRCPLPVTAEPPPTVNYWANL
jgi:hypothetical protein